MKPNLNSTRGLDESSTENGILTISFASETPVTRYDHTGIEYEEVLLCNPEQVNFERLIDGRCNFLLDHDQTKVIGVVEKAYISNKKVYADIRFGSDEKSLTAYKAIKDGIRRNISVGYVIDDFFIKDNTVYARKWTPTEISSVSVPADVNVGYQRSLETKKEKIMLNKEDTTIDSSEETTEVDEGRSKCENEKEDRESNEGTEKELESSVTEESEKQVEKTDSENEEEEKICGSEEIRSILNTLNKLERSFAEKCIQDEISFTEFKLKLQEFRSNTNKENKKQEKTMEKFSITKAIANYLPTTKPENLNKFEADVIAENERTFGKSEKADFMLSKSQLRGGQTATVANLGGALAQTQYHPELYSEVLRPENIISKIGYTEINGKGNASITIPSMTSGTACAMTTIDGEIAETSAFFENLTLTPHKAGGYNLINYSALKQCTPEMDAIISNDMNNAISELIDNQIIAGDGTGNNISGVVTQVTQTVPVSGAFTLAGVYGMEKVIRDANYFGNDLTFVMNSKNAYKYKTTLKSNVAGADYLMSEDNKMLGYNVVICNQLDDNTVILGKFGDNLIVASWDGIEMQIDPYGQNKKQAVAILYWTSFDAILRRKNLVVKTVQ